MTHPLTTAIVTVTATATMDVVAADGDAAEVVAVDAEEDDNDPVVKAQKAFVEDMTNSAGEQTYKTPAC